MNQIIMAALARFEANKNFIVEHVDYRSLFDYLVDHGKMDVRFRNKFARAPCLDNIKTLGMMTKVFCEKILIKYINDTDDVLDNILFHGLIATGQKDIVLKIFPDYLERLRQITLNRIDVHRAFLDRNIDVTRIMTYMKDNNLEIPDFHNNPLSYREKIHAMQTRADKNKPIPFWTFLSKRISNAEYFDYNRDIFIQALMETLQKRLVRYIFPHIDLIVTFP